LQTFYFYVEYVPVVSDRHQPSERIKAPMYVHFIQHTATSTKHRFLCVKHKADGYTRTTMYFSTTTSHCTTVRDVSRTPVSTRKHCPVARQRGIKLRQRPKWNIFKNIRRERRFTKPKVAAFYVCITSMRTYVGLRQRHCTNIRNRMPIKLVGLRCKLRSA